jgi:hypothetical protein
MVMSRDFVSKKRNGLRSSAKKHKRFFDLSASTIQKLLSNPVCCLCQKFCDVDSEDVKEGLFDPDSFTVDRINPFTGYVASNVQVLCAKCNNEVKSREDQQLYVALYGKKKMG